MQPGTAPKDPQKNPSSIESRALNLCQKQVKETYLDWALQRTLWKPKTWPKFSSKTHIRRLKHHLQIRLFPGFFCMNSRSVPYFWHCYNAPPQRTKNIYMAGFVQPSKRPHKTCGLIKIQYWCISILQCFFLHACHGMKSLWKLMGWRPPASP